jgi:3-hydroxyisobutyrate dehydrogenase-like beta-hydroxyacid dehydrogenase
MAVIGLLHPGAMGASIGAALRRNGHEVLYAREGRSERTVARAGAAGIERRDKLADVVAAADVIVSVCPPEAAVDVAQHVASLSFAGLYIDANAIAPSTAAHVAAIVDDGGARFVDGSIIGGPVEPGGSTRLYLSGARAREAASLFAVRDPDVVVLDGDAVAASTHKMCYASWTKVTGALVVAVAAAARAGGVEDALAAEWERSQPQAVEKLRQTARTLPAKAWRFAAEFEEMACTFDDLGLPDGFACAAEAIAERLHAYKDRDGVSLEELLDAITGEVTP